MHWKFKAEIGGALEPLLQITDIDISTEDLYKRFKGTTNQTTEEVVGRRCAKQVYKMSEAVEDACKHRRHARLYMLKDPNDKCVKKTYKELNWQVENAAKIQKKVNLKTKIKEIENNFLFKKFH